MGEKMEKKRNIKSWKKKGKACLDEAKDAFLGHTTTKSRLDGNPNFSPL